MNDLNIQRVANVQRAAKRVSFMRGHSVRNQKYQRFTLALRNTSGVIECAFFSGNFDGASYPPHPELCDRIIGATNQWKAVPQVSASVAFGGVGCGVYSGSQYLFLNTRPQSPYSGVLGWVNLTFYSGNNTRVTPYLYNGDGGIVVLGSGQINRPILLLCNDLSSGYPLFGTAWLPNGCYAYFDFTLFLA